MTEEGKEGTAWGERLSRADPASCVLLHLRQGWGENDRGVSYTFGPDCVTEFLQKHDLDLVCRAHQVGVADGRKGERRVTGTGSLRV